MKTVTPNELGEFAESLLEHAPAQSEILIVQDGEPVARIERTDKRRLEIKALVERIRENRKGQRLDGLSIRELFAQLSQKRAGINIDMETLRAYHEEGRR